MMGKFKTFKNFSPLERRILIRSFFLLTAVKFSLLLLGFRRSYKALQIIGSSTRIDRALRSSISDIDQVQSIAKMVEVAARILPFEVKCLPISMVLWYFLHRQNISSDMRIGVKQTKGQFEAHSWIEIAGQPICQRADVRDNFSPFSEPIIPSILASEDSIA